MFKRIPHTYVIVFSLILFAAALTWVLPGGEYKRQKVDVNGVEREVVINNSFRFAENAPQTWEVFGAFFKGFEKQAHIIVFILIIGGAFWVINKTKAIDAGIMSFINSARHFNRYKLIRITGFENIVIVCVMLIFSIFGAVFGMSEETIAFVIIFIPLSVSMGFDSIVGVCMCYVGAHIGFAGAMLNPFTIGIAQGISQIPLFSGIEYRFFCWVIITFTGILFVLLYARKIKRNPEKSIVYEDDEIWRKENGSKPDSSGTGTNFNKASLISFILTIAGLVAFSVLYPETSLSIGNKTFVFPAIPILTALFTLSGIISLRKSLQSYILHLLLFTILFLITGVIGYGWYVMEIASLFLVLGVLAGITFGYGANRIAGYFIEGARDILSAAMIVGLAGGIIIILNDGKIIDTLLYYISVSLKNFGKTGSVTAMYVIQTLLNIVIPSGSAKAALTMPMMSQFSDLIGLSRQATVMAFQFGDGFTNMITPTSGVLLGVLSIAKIQYIKWFKWVLPLIIILFVLGWLLLIPTVMMELNGF